jgi:hypothetical protein
VTPFTNATAETLLHAMCGEICVARRLASVALAARASRLGGAVRLLQRTRLCIQCSSLLCAGFGRGQNPAASGWPAPKQREDVHRATSRRME